MRIGQGTHCVPSVDLRFSLSLLCTVGSTLLTACGTEPDSSGSVVTKSETSHLERDLRDSAPPDGDLSHLAPPNPCSDDVLSVHWELDLACAMQRAQRERKPVLIAFSARRQEAGFEDEF